MLRAAGAAPTEAAVEAPTTASPSVVCSECPAGHGAAGPCNVTAVAGAEVGGCEPCVPGSTFNDGVSGDGRTCRTCRTCPPHSVVKRSCNATHDTECECARDYYAQVLAADGGPADEGSHAVRHSIHRHSRRHPAMDQPTECRPCELCQHGWGAARACSATQNTVCRKCPSGTYSSLLSASLGCSVCSTCSEDQVTLHECTPIQDTVCAGTYCLSSASLCSMVRKVESYSKY